MTIEGATGIAAGLSAGSISLTGWALSSAVEALASIIVTWRFTGARTLSDLAETRAQKAVGRLASACCRRLTTAGSHQTAKPTVLCTARSAWVRRIRRTVAALTK
jgi:hypothetical protein